MKPKKLTRQVTVSEEAECVAVIITMLNKLSAFAIKRVLKAVGAYFQMLVAD